jgi:SAM-dependent methyltransferase
MGLPAAIGYTFIGRPVRFALGIGALLLVGGISRGILHSQVHQERSFFGVMTVMDKPAENESPTTFRFFVHGDTNHGQQNLDPERHREPLAYYFRTGPIGQLFDSLSKGSAKRRVAVLGLGAGALACYAEENQDWTFYEIDPAVESIARSYFTFLKDAQDRGVRVQVMHGDGRLSLAHAPDHSYDLIFADAFTSDAVPVHLLTRQALELYLSKLADGGLIVFNVTNRYVDLEPVLGALAAHAGLVCISRKEDTRKLSKAEENQGKVAAHWVVMARTETDLGTLVEKPAWKEVPPGPAEWTDDYSNLLGAFRW